MLARGTFCHTPRSSLLFELDRIEFDDDMRKVLGSSPELPEASEFSEEISDDKPISSDTPLPAHEPSLFIQHCQLRTFNGITTSAQRADHPRFDIDVPSFYTEKKDMGETPLISPSELPIKISSTGQALLRQLLEVIRDEPVSESRLQFLPRWMLDKAILEEKKNFALNHAFEEWNIRALPRDANLISSHCFFQLKHDGTTDKLKLKCRLVPHGNRDKDKESLRKDSATAQFSSIRSLLSAAAILQLDLATIDVKIAYLQAGSLNRDVFVRLPHGWSPSPLIVWKLLVPAYGLVESGRLWQLAAEEWLFSTFKVECVPGLVQLFVLHNEMNEVKLHMAKVVDDFLLAGHHDAISEFHKTISRKFKIGRFVTGSEFVFNRLSILK